MPLFEYEIENLGGQRQSGSIDAGTLAEAASRLSATGCRVVRLSAGSPVAVADPAPQPVQTAPYAGPIRSIPATFRQVPKAELREFFGQLRPMVHAGVDLTQAFDTLAHQMREPALRAASIDLRDSVRPGQSIAGVLDRYPLVFPSNVRRLINAGERGGYLVNAIDQVLDLLVPDIAQRRINYAVIRYLLGLTVGVIFVVFGSSLMGGPGSYNPGDDGPSRHRASSPPPNLNPSWTIGSAVLLVGGLYLIWVVARRAMANPVTAARWQRIGYQTPILGGILSGRAQARFVRNFGMGIQSGLTAAESVELGADACGNEGLRERLLPAAAEIRRGVPLDVALANTKALDPVVVESLATGRVAGAVPAMAGYAANKVDERAKVLLGVATVVGLILLRYFLRHAMFGHWGFGIPHIPDHRPHLGGP